ncbi:EamA family transporter RarD [Cellulomonas sp. DKR-3]|uniref:EamA family transporter RarD n=1 Tax=Cellulomonas fulva TaxID=2835530 RepID=A0ABS5TYN6_9CELL|nr:EamA family transporter RarD [Cellulomonas fulva]MBT0994268.1 EamA family transporter RarD [Cellulomonas fulva]
MTDLDPRRGLGAGLGAYVLWGLLPLYFTVLAPAGPAEVVAHRALWSLVFCAAVLTVTRTWRELVVVLRSPRTLGLLALAAVLLATNWLVFVLGVQTDRVVDASLGYFVNPLVTVTLAVTVLHERLRRAQVVALSFGALAVVVLAVGYGQVPWIALVLAASFGLYGLIKNRGVRGVAAAPGLAAETLVLAPLALAFLLVLHAQGHGTFLGHGWGHAALLALSGVLTSVPLLLFNAAARVLPLTVVGLLQYVTPVMHFVIGVALLGERMPPARWAGFALVWVALTVLTVDGLRAGRGARRVGAGAVARPGSGPGRGPGDGGELSAPDAAGRPPRRP